MKKKMLCVICLIWIIGLLTLKTLKSPFNSKINNYVHPEITENCKTVKNVNETSKNVSETDLEYNFDYKTLLQCFNLDESRFFHLPFVSYVVSKKWVFQGLANHIYSSNIAKIYPENVKCGDMIYVKSDFIKDFIENYHLKISNPYILITHQSDFSVGYPEHLEFLNDPKVIKWFGQNVISRHPKLEPIPIGVVPPINQHFSVFSDFAKKSNSYYNRSILLYLNFTPQTNRNRSVIMEYFDNFFKNKKNVVINKKRIQWAIYLSHLKKSQFVLCPPGNGIDTHRTWEALAMGAVPIVLKSELQPLYDDMPVMVVNDWTEVTESNMQKFKIEKLNNFDKNEIPLRPKLWLRYWISKIMNEKYNYVKQFC